MEYKEDFHRSFIERTHKNLTDYTGEYEATHLINRLLGLLIVPKEKLIEDLPTTPLDALDTEEWGNIPMWPNGPTRCDLGHEHVLTLRQFVRRLRNAVAHFGLSPLHDSGVVRGFKFEDGNNGRNDFSASTRVNELRRFIIKMAKTLTPSAEATPC